MNEDETAWIDDFHTVLCIVVFFLAIAGIIVIWKDIGAIYMSDLKEGIYLWCIIAVVFIVQTIFYKDKAKKLQQEVDRLKKEDLKR